MNFLYDILIPFIIGLLGIYLSYSIFDLFLEFSFGIVDIIKKEIKKKKTKYGKLLTIVISIAIIPITTIIVVGNIFGENALTIKAIFKILSGLLGFILFIAFFDSPLHKKYKNSDKD